uniref:Uncharacterized protein n=1 Tax=Chrysotila carterae TaxID=13221 RepID=A0A7S4B2U5_CHRCT
MSAPTAPPPFGPIIELGSNAHDEDNLVIRLPLQKTGAILLFVLIGLLLCLCGLCICARQNRGCKRWLAKMLGLTPNDPLMGKDYGPTSSLHGPRGSHHHGAPSKCTVLTGSEVPTAMSATSSSALGSPDGLDLEEAQKAKATCNRRTEYSASSELSLEGHALRPVPSPRTRGSALNRNPRNSHGADLSGVEIDGIPSNFVYHQPSLAKELQRRSSVESPVQPREEAVAHACSHRMKATSAADHQPEVPMKPESPPPNCKFSAASKDTSKFASGSKGASKVDLRSGSDSCSPSIRQRNSGDSAFASPPTGMPPAGQPSSTPSMSPDVLLAVADQEAAAELAVMGLFRHGSLQRELYQRVSGEPSRESSARTESSFSSKAEGQPCAAESTSGPLARARKARKKPHAKGDAGAKQPADMVLGDEAGIFKNTNLQRRLQERVSFEEAK